MFRQWLLSSMSGPWLSERNESAPIVPTQRVPTHEMNIVTCGPFFDLEAKLAWQQVCGAPLDAERLYMFEVPPATSHEHHRSMF